MTSEELFKKYSNLYQFEEGSPEYLIDKEDFQKAVIEFTQMHLNMALKAVCENAVLGKVGSFGTYWNRGDLVLDEESVFNAYPKDKIQ